MGGGTETGWLDGVELEGAREVGEPVVVAGSAVAGPPYRLKVVRGDELEQTLEFLPALESAVAR